MGSVSSRQPDPRLHHGNGAHRESPVSSNGRDAEWFEQHIQEHLQAHQTEVEERWAATGMTALRSTSSLRPRRARFANTGGVGTVGGGSGVIA